MNYRLSADATLSAGYSRNRRPVWGVAGGEDGGTNGLAIVRTDGSDEDHAFASDLALKPVALANKNARIAWAMLAGDKTTNPNYPRRLRRTSQLQQNDRSW